MSLSLRSFFSQVYSFYKPYFGRRGAALKRTLLALGIIALNILSAIVFSFFNASLNAIFGVLESPGVTWSAFFGATGVSLGYLVLWLGFEALKLKLVNRLTDSLTKAVKESLLNRWAKNKGYYGIKFLPSKNPKAEAEDTELNPAQIMASEHNELIKNLSYSIDQFVTVLGNFIVGAIALYSLSMPLTFAVFGMTFIIPGYMALGAFGYALAYNFITNKMGAPLAEVEKALRKEQDAFNTRSNELSTQAEPIAFLGGTQNEHESLRAKSSNMDKHSSALNSLLNRIYFVTKMHGIMGSFFVPLLLAAPSIIARTMPLSMFYQVMQYFNYIVQCFTWKNENLPILTPSNVSLSRIGNFESLLTKWEELLKKANKIEMEQGGLANEIQFKDITVLYPNGEPMLSNFTFTLYRGKAILIQAPSGAGKSTLARAIAGLWPYMGKGGKIVSPKGDSLRIEFIPQKAFVYHKGQSLLQTILYPSSDKPTQAEIDYIKSLMQRMHIKAEIINQLGVDKDWTVLSGGEKQRINILRAILKKPDVLFMDEATSAIDKDVKPIVEGLILEELPNCAIVYTDHNPSHECEELYQPKAYMPAQDAARAANAFHHNTINLSSQSIARSESGLVI